MTQHIPGPWAVVNDGDDKEDPILHIVAEDGVVIATGLEFGLNYERCQANARLIAAAPDLLEALQTLIDALPEDGEWGHFLDIKQAARAALRKATDQ